MTSSPCAATERECCDAAQAPLCSLDRVLSGSGRSLLWLSPQGVEVSYARQLSVHADVLQLA